MVNHDVAVVRAEGFGLAGRASSASRSASTVSMLAWLRNMSVMGAVIQEYSCQ